MSVTLKLSDRDAKLAAEVLFEAKNWRALRLSQEFGKNWEEEALRLSAAFQTAYEANVR